MAIRTKILNHSVISKLQVTSAYRRSYLSKQISFSKEFNHNRSSKIFAGVAELILNYK